VPIRLPVTDSSRGVTSTTASLARRAPRCGARLPEHQYGRSSRITSTCSRVHLPFDVAVELARFSRDRAVSAAFPAHRREGQAQRPRFEWVGQSGLGGPAGITLLGGFSGPSAPGAGRPRKQMATTSAARRTTAAAPRNSWRVCMGKHAQGTESRGRDSGRQAGSSPA